MTVRILVGDARARLRELPAESVHCVVTSPPYWGLRDYGVEGAIGLEPTFDQHLDVLVHVFREVRRVLRKDGTCWLNYGDVYATGTAAKRPPSANRGVGGWSNAANDGGRRADCRTLKPKDLMMMPARVAMALQADGIVDAKALQAIERAQHAVAEAYFYDQAPIPDRVRMALDVLAQEYAEAKGDSWWLRSEIVWHKPNPRPESVLDRPILAHEKVFLLTKSARYFYDAKAVRIPVTGGAHARRKDGELRPAKGSDPHDRRAGTWKEKTDKQREQPPRHSRYGPMHKGLAALDRVPKDDQQANGANLRNVWSIPTYGYPGAHFATFPPALVEPCVKAGCPVGGTVLDPFAGAGTVGLVADRLGRDSILIELNPAYAAMARARIEADAPLLTIVA